MSNPENTESRVPQRASSDGITGAWKHVGFQAVVLAIAFFVTLSAANGDTLGRASFGWNAVPDPIVCGYKVYWGTQSGVYDQSLDAGNVTEVTISGFLQGPVYFLAVTSYSDTGEESDYSNQISFVVLSSSSTTTPVITTNPTATNIVFGQTLASSTLSGGVASVPGTFAFTAPATAPLAGTTLQTITFTPADTGNYQIITASVPVTVSKATPSITTQPTATEITYGQTLASSTLSGGSASVPGHFAFSTPATVPTTGTALQNVAFTPTDTSNYQTVTLSISVTVKDAPTPNVATVTLGNLTTLYDGTPKVPSATTNPSGLSVNLTYNGSATIPTNAGSYEVLATIADASYSGSTSGTLIIAKATPTITTQPTATAITYGQTLANSTLYGGAASVPGSFGFSPSDPSRGTGDTSGQARFGWDAVPDPIVCGYKVYWGTQSRDYDHSLDAGNVTEAIIAEFAAGVQYFLAVTSYSDTGEESDFSSEIVFTVLASGGTTPPVVGTSSFSVTFTPTDTDNYEPVTTNANVTVLKATPLIITQPTATAITYGQTLASSTLSGGATSVPGSFEFATPTTQPIVGTSIQSVTFTPADSSNYETISTSVNVTVNKATAIVTLGNLAAAYDATPKVASATTNPTGLEVNLTYNGSAVPPTNAGSYAVAATIVAANYGGSTSGTLIIAKATPLITTQPTATAITYGQTLASSSLSGGVASVPGSFAFATPATIPAAGITAQSVTFTPTDTLNYQDVTTTVNVTTSNGATITLGKLATTYDGTTKSVSATTTPSGLTVKVTYNGSTTAPKNAGSYAVVATIVDAAYTGSVSATLVIAKATPSITTKPTAKGITYGQTLASSTLSRGAASVAGSFAFTTPTAVPPAGTASQSVTFTPADSINYQTASTSVNVTVAKAKPVIVTKPTASTIVYGQTLASSILSGGVASVSGSFAFTKPTTVPAVGTSSQGVTFTPTDTMNYQNATTTVSVTVKAASSLAISPETLESWRTRCFTSEQIAAGQAADDADPDGDGLVNLAEYALGTNPLVATPQPKAVKNGEGLVLTFDRPTGLPDVLYAAESSDDLVHWNPCLLEVVVDGPVQTMRAVDPLTSGDPSRRFISLRFTKP